MADEKKLTAYRILRRRDDLSLSDRFVVEAQGAAAAIRVARDKLKAEVAEGELLRLVAVPVTNWTEDWSKLKTETTLVSVGHPAEMQYELAPEPVEDDAA